MVCCAPPSAIEPLMVRTLASVGVTVWVAMIAAKSLFAVKVRVYGVPTAAGVTVSGFGVTVTLNASKLTV
jgi:hypothetical protein